jgi:hypothetical protein
MPNKKNTKRKPAKKLKANIKLAKNDCSRIANFFNLYWPYLILLMIIATSVTLKLYYLKDNLHFNIDEANQIKTIVSIYSEKIFPLKGPSASGDTGLYHGAYYYYLYFLPTLLSKGSPLTLGIFTLLLNTLSLPLLFFTLKKTFSLQLALYATLIMATSSTIIYYSRWAWNPNLIPFFFILALFSLGQINSKKPWWLIIFAFAISSISQLHIGASFYIIIFILMLPLFFRVTKDIKIYLASVLALLLPWIPTIIYESQNGWSLFGNLFKKISQEEIIDTSFAGHATKGWEFLAQTFTATIYLPQIILILSLLAFLGLLVFQTKWRDREKCLLPIFIAISLIFSFSSCSYYNGSLFTHYAEEFFVILPIISALLIENFAREKVLSFGAVAILVTFAINNYLALQNDIIVGNPSFAIQNRICRNLKDRGLDQVTIKINGQTDPEYIKYICQKYYSINFANEVHVEVDTNSTKGFSYKVIN